MRKFLAMAISLGTLFTILGCGGGGGGGGGGTVELDGLAYSQDFLVATIGTAIEDNVPDIAKGKADKFAIDPALPDGLVLDEDTGVISGTPLARRAEAPTTRFTITATNNVSETQVEIEITVIAPQKFLVPDIDNNQVTIFDLSNTQILANLVFVDTPRASAFGNDRFVIVSDDGTNTTATVVDSIDNQILATIPLAGVSNFPRVFFADNRFVINGLDNVSVIDATTNTLVAVVNVGGTPVDIAFGRGLFGVLLQNSQLVLIDDNNTVVNTIPLNGTEGTDLAFGNNLFAAIDNVDENVVFVDAGNNQIVNTIAVGNSPTRIEFGGQVFAVVNTGDQINDSSVTFIDADDASNIFTIDQIATGDQPIDIAFGNNRFAIVNQFSNDVTIVEAIVSDNGDAVNVLATVSVNISPSQVVFGGGQFLVSHAFDDTAVLINAVDNQVVDNVAGIVSNVAAQQSASFSQNNNATFCYSDGVDIFIVDANTNGIIAHPNFFLSNRRSLGRNSNPHSEIEQLRRQIREQKQILKSGQVADRRQIRDKIVANVEKIRQISQNIKKSITQSKRSLQQKRAQKRAFSIAGNKRSLRLPKFTAFGNDRFVVSDGIGGIGEVFIVDVKTNAIIDTLAFNGEIRSVAFGVNRFVLTDNINDQVIVIDANNNSTVATIAQVDPFDVAFGNNRFVVLGVAEVLIIDLNGNELQRLPFVGVSVEFGNDSFAVADPVNQEIVIIDATNNNIVAQIPQSVSLDAFVDFGNDRFAITNPDEDLVNIVDALQNIQLVSIDSAGIPLSVAFGNNRFAAINQLANTLTAIDAAADEAIALVNVGIQPEFIEFGNNRYAIASDFKSEYTLVDAIFNVQTTTIQSPIFMFDMAIAFNPGE